MRKFFKVMSALALCSVLAVPSSVFAMSDTPQLISEEVVRLTVPSEAMNTAKTSSESKEFVLKKYDDNGVTVYGFDVEDPEYRQAAKNYIIKLTGDPGGVAQPLGETLAAGDSYYLNDTAYDGNAESYAWKRNTWGTYDNNYEGGQASSWNGSGNVSSIVLNQTISVSGIGLSVTWPPGVTGTSTTGSWTSQPYYNNVAGASFSGMRVGGTAWSTSFSENGDVYYNNRAYRPMTYISFNLF